MSDVANAVSQPASVTEELSRFVAELSVEKVPADVLHRTKLCILDCLGTIVAAADSDPGKSILKAASLFNSSDVATVFGTKQKLSPPKAALANGTLAEVFELQDGWRFGNNHPCVITPAAFAAAEYRACDGKNFLASVVAGYEVANRLAWAVHPHHLAKGYLPTGTAGACGAAAAASRVFAHDAERTSESIGTAGFLAPISTAETLWAGYTAKPLHSGWAAMTGFESSILAEEGFAGCPVEGSPQRGRGFLEITTGTVLLERITRQLGEYYTVKDVYFKLYPACRHSHGSVEAVLNLIKSERIDVEKIRAVRVFTYELSANLLNRYTDVDSSVIAAQFSIPYVVAATLKAGSIGVEQFALDKRQDTEILELSRKVEVISDSEITALYPDITPTRVEIEFADGRKISNMVRTPVGDPRTPVDENTLFEKFNGLVGRKYDHARVRRITDAIMNVETYPDMREVTAILGA